MNILKDLIFGLPLAFTTDFDGTAANTLDGVHGAVLKALISVFGPTVEPLYKKVGGLKNRAPRELVEALLKEGTAELSILAFRFLERNKNKLNGYVPEEKAIPLIWDDDDPLTIMTELFVLQKLRILIRGISTKSGPNSWPQLMTGFKEKWEELSKNPNVFTVVLSSGHDIFINMVFDLWGLTRPDLMLTDDDARFATYKGGEALCKPDSRLMDKVLVDLRERTGIDEFSMIYFGDDLIKDGKLAENSGVPFFHFDLNNQNEHVNSFNDWSILSFVEKATSTT